MWTDQPPESPTGLISEFYWYFDPAQNKKWVVELWPKRYVKHYTGLWWPEPIKQPSSPDWPEPREPNEALKKALKNHNSKVEEIPKKRGRPAKPK